MPRFENNGVNPDDNRRREGVSKGSEPIDLGGARGPKVERHITATFKDGREEKIDIPKDGVIGGGMIGDAVSVVIPNGVTKIVKRAFEGFCYLESVTIPNDHITICDEAFAHCSHLKSVTTYDGVNRYMGGYFTGSIGMCAFESCTSLIELEIPRVKIIEVCAFEFCSSLRRVIIPPSVEFVSECVFSHCSRLEEIWYPETLNENSYERFGYHLRGSVEELLRDGYSSDYLRYIKGNNARIYAYSGEAPR